MDHDALKRVVYEFPKGLERRMRRKGSRSLLLAIARR